MLRFIEYCISIVLQRDQKGSRVSESLFDMLIKALQRAYTMPFRLLAIGIGIYQLNRNRVRVLLDNPRAKLMIRSLIIATFFAWLIIWWIAGNPHSNELDKFIQEKVL